MNYFNQIKYEHPGDLLWRSIELKVVEKLLKGIEIKEPIIDLACGNGEIAKIMFPSKVIYGFDIITERINEQVQYGDVTKLDIPSRSYPTAFSNSSFEHIPNHIRAYMEAYRILKKDGLFICTLVSPFFKKNLLFKNPLYGWLRCKRANIHHLHYLHEWAQAFDSFGFKIINAEYFMDKRSSYLFDKLAWIYNFGLSHQKYMPDILSCYEHDKTGWGGSGIAIIARKK